MKEFKELTKQELEETSGGVAMPALWFLDAKPFRKSTVL